MSIDSPPTTKDNSSPDNHNWKGAKWGAVAVVTAAAITGVATYLAANPVHVWPPSPPLEYRTLRVEVPQKDGKLAPGPFDVLGPGVTVKPDESAWAVVRNQKDTKSYLYPCEVTSTGVRCPDVKAGDSISSGTWDVGIIVVNEDGRANVMDHKRLFKDDVVAALGSAVTGYGRSTASR
jgi:hypothetical protein